MYYSFHESNQKKLEIEQTLTLQTQSIKSELMKIDNLQSKIKAMQIELNCWGKIDKSCDKQNKNQVQNALLTIKNRVNHTQSFMQTIKYHKKVANIQLSNKNRIKELRQRGIEQLQNAKRQNKKVKQTMMREIKQISLRNQSMIKRNKQQIQQQNKIKKNQIKNQKEIVRQMMIQNKIQKLKQKHQFEMEKSKERLSKQTELEMKLQQLEMEKELLIKRVEDKKQYSQKLQSIYSEISQMSHQQIHNTMKQIKKKIRLQQINKKEKQKSCEGYSNQSQDENYLRYRLFEKYLQQQVRQKESISMIF